MLLFLLLLLLGDLAWEYATGVAEVSHSGFSRVSTYPTRALRAADPAAFSRVVSYEWIRVIAVAVFWLLARLLLRRFAQYNLLDPEAPLPDSVQD